MLYLDLVDLFHLMRFRLNGSVIILRINILYFVRNYSSYHYTYTTVREFNDSIDETFVKEWTRIMGYQNSF